MRERGTEKRLLRIGQARQIKVRREIKLSFAPVLFIEAHAENEAGAGAVRLAGRSYGKLHSQGGRIEGRSSTAPERAEVRACLSGGKRTWDDATLADRKTSF